MLRPVGHRILIELEKVEEKRGEIYLPQDAVDRQQMAIDRGVVVAVGPDAWHDKPAPWAVVGDKVVFVQNAGSISRADGKIYRFMNDLDVVGVDE